MLIIDNDFVRQWKPLILKIIGESNQQFNEEAVEELMYRTWVKIMTNARYYTPKYAVSTFIRLQTTNSIYDYIQKDIASHDAMKHKVTNEIPEEIYDSHDIEKLVEELKPLLALLDSPDRDIFVDRILNSMPVNDVADKYDIHRKSVSRVIKRTTEKLRRLAHKPRKKSRKQYVVEDMTLEVAIMQMDDAHYHTYRMRHFEGKSIVEICNINGMSPDRNIQLLQEAHQFLEQEL